MSHYFISGRREPTTAHKVKVNHNLQTCCLQKTCKCNQPKISDIQLTLYVSSNLLRLTVTNTCHDRNTNLRMEDDIISVSRR